MRKKTQPQILGLQSQIRDPVLLIQSKDCFPVYFQDLIAGSLKKWLLIKNKKQNQKQPDCQQIQVTH